MSSINSISISNTTDQITDMQEMKKQITYLTTKVEILENQINGMKSFAKDGQKSVQDGSLEDRIVKFLKKYYFRTFTALNIAKEIFGDDGKIEDVIPSLYYLLGKDLVNKDEMFNRWHIREQRQFSCSVLDKE